MSHLLKIVSRRIENGEQSQRRLAKTPKTFHLRNHFLITNIFLANIPTPDRSMSRELPSVVVMDDGVAMTPFPGRTMPASGAPVVARTSTSEMDLAMSIREPSGNDRRRSGSRIRAITPESSPGLRGAGGSASTRRQS